jgi:hypothetical protein
MPVLDLPKDPPIAGANTLAYPIMSVMLFPQEEEAKGRRHWLACSAASAYVNWKQIGVHWSVLAEFHGWIGELWELPQSPKRVFQDGWARVRRAVLAGEMLKILLRLARHHPSHCSVERARALLQHRLQEKNPSKAPSESLLAKAWPDFKTASHLWAAYLDCEHGLKGHPEKWLKILSVSEAYRREAESTRLLKAIETWRTADDLPLPASEIEVPPLPSEELAYLCRELPL